jgi:hypothetical protein
MFPISKRNACDFFNCSFQLSDCLHFGGMVALLLWLLVVNASSDGSWDASVCPSEIQARVSGYILTVQSPKQEPAQVFVGLLQPFQA